MEASATEDGTYRADNVSHSGTALTATVTGVAVGETRWVRVLALNAKGNSRLKLSVATATNTKTTPHVVQNLSVTAAAPDGETKLTVTWEAPVSDGGHAITVYNVEARDAEGTYSTANVAYKPTVNPLTATLTNLAAGATRLCARARRQLSGRRPLGHGQRHHRDPPRQSAEPARDGWLYEQARLHLGSPGQQWQQPHHQVRGGGRPATTERSQ